MKSVYDCWKTVETDAHGFAGANTPAGFCSSYDIIADERSMERVYIIKGGAGTGKSTLMYKIASAAEKQGRRCEYYLCGSDPDSLDCVVIDGKIAVLDGTAPHVREMKYPGASSSMIDISRFWDSSVLIPHREELVQRSAAKTAAYASSYRWLAAADAVHREQIALSAKLFDEEKARGYIGRLLGKLGKIQQGESRMLWSHAVTMKGRWRIKFRPGTRTFRVSDYYGTAAVFMNLLNRILTEEKIAHTTYSLPLTDTLSAVYLTDSGITFAVGESDGTVVNMKRFVKETVPEGLRGRIRLSGEITESCLNAASEALADAAEQHFAIESVYKPAMDFKALNKYNETVTREILTHL